MGVQVIPIPIEEVSHSHSQFSVLFPFPWDSHGIPIPMHISSPCVSSPCSRDERRTVPDDCRDLDQPDGLKPRYGESGKRMESFQSLYISRRQSPCVCCVQQERYKQSESDTGGV